MTTFRSRLLIPSLLGCGVLAAGGFAQNQNKDGVAPPAPAASSADYITASGKVTQLNYNREAEVGGFLLDGKILVQLPPRESGQFISTVHAGDALQVSGPSRTSQNGFQTIDARRAKDGTTGKSFAAAEPGAAAPLSSSGRIRQLNYDADGSINGFVLDNGTLANTPPFGPSNPSSIKAGATIAFTGFAHKAPNGTTVVDVQNITLNGQALTLAQPIARRGPGRRGPRPSGPGDLRSAARPTPPPPPPAPLP